MTPQQIRRMISVERDDSEWDVQEYEFQAGQLVRVEVARALREKANSVLCVTPAPASVVLAYYHTGFSCDPPELLDVCASVAVAESVLARHKATRDRGVEFRDKATWWVTSTLIRVEPMEQAS